MSDTTVSKFFSKTFSINFSYDSVLCFYSHVLCKTVIEFSKVWKLLEIDVLSLTLTEFVKVLFWKFLEITWNRVWPTVVLKCCSSSFLPLKFHVVCSNYQLLIIFLKNVSLKTYGQGSTIGICCIHTYVYFY